MFGTYSVQEWFGTQWLSPVDYNYFVVLTNFVYKYLFCNKSTMWSILCNYGILSIFVGRKNRLVGHTHTHSVSYTLSLIASFFLRVVLLNMVDKIFPLCSVFYSSRGVTKTGIGYYCTWVNHVVGNLTWDGLLRASSLTFCDFIIAPSCQLIFMQYTRILFFMSFIKYIAWLKYICYIRAI